MWFKKLSVPIISEDFKCSLDNVRIVHLMYEFLVFAPRAGLDTLAGHTLETHAIEHRIMTPEPPIMERARTVLRNCKCILNILTR